MGAYRSVGLPAQAAAGADAVTVVGTVSTDDDTEATVLHVEVLPPPGYVTVTGVATNNATLNVRQVRAGAVVATFASLTLAAGTNLVAETVTAIPLTQGVTLAQDDVLDVVLHQNGTGLAIGAGLLVTIDVN